jgi:hypothetical protein
VTARRRASLLAAGAAVAAIATLAAACSDGGARECRVGADCASGACAEDGTCVRAAAVTPADADASTAPPTDAAAEDGGGLDAAVPGCTPNKDGTITREEVPLVAGLSAKFRVASNEVVSTAGVANGDGTRTWDFSAALPSDSSVIVETLPVTGKWYAPDFTGATYASRLSNGSTLLGVFRTSAPAIDMLGVVSPDDGLYRTRLTYASPVTVLAFPLTPGKTWTTDTTVSGLLSGVISAYAEKYESEVDARGKLVTPLGTFDVLRVRVLLTRAAGFTTIRSFAFVTECYGTVASVTSKENEATVEFTQAAELKRIAP